MLWPVFLGCWSWSSVHAAGVPFRTKILLILTVHDCFVGGVRATVLYSNPDNCISNSGEIRRVGGCSGGPVELRLETVEDDGFRPGMELSVIVFGENCQA